MSSNVRAVNMRAVLRLPNCAVAKPLFVLLAYVPPKKQKTTPGPRGIYNTRIDAFVTVLREKGQKMYPKDIMR